MSNPTPMTHAEIVDVLLTAKVRCSTFPMSGLTAAERDAEHARIDRAIAALRKEPPKPEAKAHKWVFYMNGTFCSRCNASLGQGGECR